jgi:hypothetical protein
MWKNNLLFLLLVTVLAGGCIRENLSDCVVELYIDFLYDKDGDGKDDFEKEVKGMVVYVFDQTTGLLVDIVEVDKADLAKGYFNPNLPDGKYTFLAWASSGQNLGDGGFSTGQMSGSDPGSYSPPTIGSTLIDDFRLYLNTTTPPGGGLPTPTMEQFDNLFYAVARDVSVKNGRPTVKTDLDFVKNSSILDVNVTGLENLPDPNTKPVVYVTGNNGVLTQNDTADPNARQIRYNPYEQVPGTNSVQEMIKVLKLDINQPTAQQPMIHITDPGTGRDLVPPIPVVDAIKKMQDESGTPLIRNQRDLDNWDQFPIDVAIGKNSDGDLTVNIKVVVEGFRPHPLL